MKPKKLRLHKGQKRDILIDDYTVIDIETTGLSSTTNDIIEIAAIKIKNGQVIDTFEVFVKIDSEVPAFITSLTGITTDMLQNALPAKEAIKLFLDFVGNDILLGHNVNFDINFLYDKSEKFELKKLDNNFIDTLTLSKIIYPEFYSHKLEVLIKLLKINVTTNHRALEDCKTTMKLYESIKKDFRKKKIDITSNIVNRKIKKNKTKQF